MDSEQAGDQPSSATGDDAKRSRLGFRPVAVAVLVVALAAFVVQNGESTAVTWLWFDSSAPLFVVIVVSAVAGAVLSELVGWMLRRRRRNQQR